MTLGHFQTAPQEVSPPKRCPQHSQGNIKPCNKHSESCPDHGCHQKVAQKFLSTRPVTNWGFRVLFPPNHPIFTNATAGGEGLTSGGCCSLKLKVFPPAVTGLRENQTNYLSNYQANYLSNYPVSLFTWSSHPCSVPHVLLEFCCPSQGAADPGPTHTMATLSSCPCSPGRGRGCCSSTLRIRDAQALFDTCESSQGGDRAKPELKEQGVHQQNSPAASLSLSPLPQLCPGLWGHSLLS